MKYCVVFLLISFNCLAQNNSFLKLLSQNSKYYPSVYQVGENYIPQVSFELKGKLNDFILKLTNGHLKMYEAKVEILPRGKVVVLLPKKKALCSLHGLCNINILSYYFYRIRYMKTLSFTHIGNTVWGSLQDSSSLLKMINESHGVDSKIYNQKLKQSITSKFFVDHYAWTSTLGKSSRNYQELMNNFDIQLSQSSKRLGKIRHDEWKDAVTLSALYHKDDTSVFILVQDTPSGSLVQVQKSGPIDTKTFSKILNKNKLLL